mgnify:CR=1 FL=1|jgi:hypothetical protein
MSDQIQEHTLPAHCPSCKYFGVDCNPDPEDYDKPCDSFESNKSERETEE